MWCRKTHEVRRRWQVARRIEAPNLLVRLDRSGSAPSVRDRPYRHMEPCSLHELNAKAGETYYFVTEYGELVPDQFTLRQVDPDEEKHLVAWAHLSAFHPK